MSRYDDELWELVPEEREPAPAEVVDFVRALGRAERALDLGGGDGRLAGEIDAGEVTVADVSAVALDRARRRLPGARVELLVPDEPLPFEDSSFDLVLCAHVVDHVRDVQLFLSEVRRVLRPGGRVAVVTFAYGRRTGIDVLARGFERRFDPLSPHLRFYTRRSLSRLLRTMGFGVTSIRRRRGRLLALATR
ncbi:MAG: phosphatidyl-myo-inositol dimannoside synthase [Thermoleophilaceae bacterium]|nr:phosphatidyl-myo-inositol dimannoside synthase [Thermoleophilaceae bacterium]